MTPEKVTELAKQAGFVGFDGKTKVLQRFAELVRAEALEDAAMSFTKSDRPIVTTVEAAWIIRSMK